MVRYSPKVLLGWGGGGGGGGGGEMRSWDVQNGVVLKNDKISLEMSHAMEIL